MIDIVGKYTSAKIFTDQADAQSVSQIQELCNREWMSGNVVRIMPDFHVGKGCVIGTTIKLKNSVEPNLVGVDIGCGVTIVPLKDKQIEFGMLDNFITNKIPHGQNVHKNDIETDWDAKALRCYKNIPVNKAYKSIGTLGSGNHYIEIDKDDEGQLYLGVHSGSRNLGLQVATYYQNIAYKSAGKSLIGDDFDDYIHDMKHIQQYASINRGKLIELIVKGCGLKVDKTSEWNINTIHNYIDTDMMILRKGAVRAKKDEKLVIPLNMRDGCLLCIGKGNPEWNESAPHGAGRLYSRSESKNSISMAEFKKSMEGIYSTCVRNSTIDESPMAYKDMHSIISQIQDTVEISKRIIPVYNFKSG